MRLKRKKRQPQSANKSYFPPSKGRTPNKIKVDVKLEPPARVAVKTHPEWAKGAASQAGSAGSV
jgi:hypothetical protein